MTIKLKNRLIFLLIFISMALILSTLAATGISLYLGNASVPDGLSAMKFQEFAIFQYRYICTFISVFIILAYTFVSLIVLGIEFEKSQSSEIIFFTAFLVGCFCEAARLSFPLMDLWDSQQSVALLATRLVLAGRTVCSISILFAAAYSKAEHRQYVERNILIIFVLGLIFGLTYPINTSVVLPEGRYEWGLRHLLNAAQHGTMTLGFISLLFESIDRRKNYRLAFGMFLISAGYMTLCAAYSIFALALGSSALIAGTAMYLKKLHDIYLWND